MIIFHFPNYSANQKYLKNLPKIISFHNIKKEILNVKSIIKKMI